MRIDLNPSSMPELDRSGKAAGAKPAGQEATTSVSTEAVDVAHLSTGSDAVQKLKAQLKAVPDVREARIDAVKQALNEGSFEVSPERIAEAMLGGDSTRG